MDDKEFKKLCYGLVGNYVDKAGLDVTLWNYDNQSRGSHQKVDMQKEILKDLFKE